MILKIFSPKISAKKLAFLTQNKAKLCKNLIITLVFEKNVNFFAENWQKSQKIVIITSTPGPSEKGLFARKMIRYQKIFRCAKLTRSTTNLEHCPDLVVVHTFVCMYLCTVANCRKIMWEPRYGM
jgi:hypothetical protein